MRLIADTFTHNLQSVGHHNKSIRIDFTNHFLETGKLGKCNDVIKNMQLLAGVSAGAVYLENAFNRGPHVLTVIKEKDRIVHVEHIFQDGFDYKGHLTNRDRTEWGERELLADIYNSRGNGLFEKEAFPEALIQYEKAIELNPRYENARLNKAIVKQKLS